MNMSCQFHALAVLNRWYLLGWRIQCDRFCGNILVSNRENDKN
jgi:hypothetical protein